MADELHDLTKLLLTRLESNPEEFGKAINSSYKWSAAVETVRLNGYKSDWETLNAALHKHYMDVGLETALKLLLNGDEETTRVGQSSNSAWPHNNPGGQFGVSGGSGGPGLTKQQAQAAIAQQQAAYQQQDVDAQVRALGFPLKPIPPLGTSTTVLGTTYEQIKKRLGL